MAFNGSGVFTRLYNWANDAAASIKIRADRFDAEMDGFATGLSTCMTKDGQQLPTAAQNFNGQNLTNVGAFGSTGNNTFSGTTTLFSGTAARIQGDFSNATIANRTAFQDKTTNTATQVNSLPNGSAVGSGFVSYASSDPTNSAYGSIYCDSSNARISSAALGSGATLPLAFNVGGSEVARFATTGHFLVATTNAAFAGSAANSKLLPSSANNGGIATGSWNNVGPAMDFYANIGFSGVYAGSINLSGSTAVLNSASDYRLKSNIQPLTSSATFIDGLQPKTWTWNIDGASGVGFIAHEAATVAPLSVNGQKDEVDADGNPKYQSVGYGSSEIIANIIAELKSLRARVATLEARP
jgi:hypothetical protein